MKKKILRILYMLFLSAGLVAFSACKGGSASGSDETAQMKMNGVYELISARAEGEESNAEQFEEMQQLGMKSVLTLEEDGKGHLNMFGTNIDISYDEENHTIKIYDQELTYTVEENVISFTWDGTELDFSKAE